MKKVTTRSSDVCEGGARMSEVWETLAAYVKTLQSL